MTSRTWPSPDQQLRAGVAPETIGCETCGDPWDGTTPFARAACATCRRLCGEIALAWGEAVLALATDPVADRVAS